jgi:hypothetical protein
MITLLILTGFIGIGLIGFAGDSAPGLTSATKKVSRRVLCWLGNPRSPFGLSETLGVAMRNHVILFDDTFGRSVIVWSAGLLQWSFSIDSRPAGRAWLTRA